MKNKILHILALAAALTVAILLVTGCGETECKHEGGTATCKTLAVCSICGESYGEFAGHSGGDATCTELATCETCGESYGETDAHIGGIATCQSAAQCVICDTFYGDVGTCAGGEATCTEKAVCETCNQPYGNFADHVGGEANCSAKAVCDVCSQEYGNLGDHAKVYAVIEAGKHSVSCSICSETVNASENCTGGEATCVSLKQCELCGGEYGTLAGHTVAYANNASGNHKIYCSFCDETLTASENCTGGHASCEYQAKCDFCDTAYGAVPSGHEYGADLVGSETAHFYACTNCNSPKLSDKAAHTFGEWTTALSATVESEGTSQRTCSECNYVQSKAIPKLPMHRMSALAIVLIVIGSVLVVAIATFAIIWFAVKKKNFGDLKAVLVRAPKEETADE